MKQEVCCVVCKTTKPILEFYIRKAGWSDGIDHRCRKCAAEKTKAYYHSNKKKCQESARARFYKNRASYLLANKKREIALKDLVFSKYGGYICACCKEKEKVFLTIDHINGGGNKHRKQTKGGGKYAYRWIKKNKFPPGFRVLCYNCNSGRARNNGICPHEEKKDNS